MEPPRHKKEIPLCIRCQQYGHTKNYCNRTPACVKCAKNHLTTHCPFTGKIEEVKCYNCNGNHPASYKGCEVRKQLQRKLFPPLRSRAITNTEAQQDSTKLETIPNTEHAINTIHISTNTFGSRSYAQVTSQSTHSDNQYHNNSNSDTTEIKELLKQSITECR